MFIVLIFAVQMVPLTALIIPLYIMLSRAHQVDKLTGVIVTYLTFVLPFSSGRCAGSCSGSRRISRRRRWSTARPVSAPSCGSCCRSSAPGLVATSIFAFIQAWNEYIIAYVLLSSQEKQTLTIWLANFTTRRGTDWGSLMAGATLTALPVVIFFVLVQRKIAFGLTAGAVKRMSDGRARAARPACCPSFLGPEAPDWLRRAARRAGSAGRALRRNVRDPEQLAALTSRAPREAADLLVAVDEEGGDVTRLEADSGSSFPGNLALGAVDDAELTERVAAAIGGELAAAGVNLDLAPVADVNVDPANPIIGVRCFGSDPELVARHVAAFVRGPAERRASPPARSTSPGTATRPPTRTSSSRSSSGRPRGARCCRSAPRSTAGVRAVMTAHTCRPRPRRAPATLSRRISPGSSATELGFDGLVITDALEMRAISGGVGVEEAAVQALAAGADALCIGHDLHEETVDALIRCDLRRRARPVACRSSGSRRRRIGWPRRPGGRQPPIRLGAPGREVGAEAARRALRIHGSLSLERDPLIVELVPDANIAAGVLVHSLADLWPGALSVRLDESTRDPAACLPAGDRPLVIVARDALRYAWQQAIIWELLTLQPDAVVIETGIPGGTDAAIETYGAGRANLEAARDVLAAARV